jgi:hypothetical protein
MSPSRHLEIVPEFLPPAECARLVDAIARHRAVREAPLIERLDARRPLRYRVVDGEAVHAHLPELEELARSVQARVRGPRWGEVVPIGNRRVAINVNITEPGGEYRWHYDRNAVTAILYLDAVAGGETECYPGYRIRLRHPALAGAQRVLDALVQWTVFALRLRPRAVIAPEPGKLVIMRGDRCLHSVRAARGPGDRLAVVMAFDIPGARYRGEQELDAYLYSASAP